MALLSLSLVLRTRVKEEHMDTDDDNVARTPGGWQTGILHSQQYLPSGVRWRTKQDRNLADCHMYQEAEAMTRRRMVHAS